MTQKHGRVRLILKLICVPAIINIEIMSESKFLNQDDLNANLLNNGSILDEFGVVAGAEESSAFVLQSNLS